MDSNEYNQVSARAIFELEHQQESGISEGCEWKYANWAEKVLELDLKGVDFVRVGRLFTMYGNRSKIWIGAVVSRRPCFVSDWACHVHFCYERTVLGSHFPRNWTNELVGCTSDHFLCCWDGSDHLSECWWSSPLGGSCRICCSNRHDGISLSYPSQRRTKSEKRNSYGQGATSKQEGIHLCILQHNLSPRRRRTHICRQSGYSPARHRLHPVPYLRQHPGLFPVRWKTTERTRCHDHLFLITDVLRPLCNVRYDLHKMYSEIGIWLWGWRWREEK